MIKLSEEMLRVLEELIEKRNPKLECVLPSIKTAEPIENKQVDALCSELSRELCESGLDDNDQPNERGKILYSLISYVNQLLKE